MSVVLSEHLPLLASAPEGIQKLRGLILELAVRGKLVPQDPDDEPASELLKLIRQERSRLDGDKARKKIEPPLHVSEAPLFELPQSWTWVSFGEIALHNAGKTLDKGRNAGQPRDYITTSNLYWGRFELGDLKQMLIGADELERCTARKNDLLICEGGEAGRAAVWSFDREVCFQNHVHRARFFGDIDPYFGFRFFEWLNASGEIEHYRKGVGISNMSGKALASIPFTLPPLAEQHRIVAKVDELMALCDRLEAEQADAAGAHARLVDTLLDTLTQSADAADLAANWQRLAEHFDALFTTEASIDALKQTVLQLAVMGRLVQQDPNDEPAGELLKRIAEERSLLVSRGELRKSATVEYSLCNRYDSLPAGWLCTDIGSVAFVVTDGTHKTPKYCTSGVKFVSAKDIRSGRLSFEDCKFISLEEHTDLVRRCRPELGDILVSKSGSIGTVVRVAVQEEFSLFESLALIKFSNQQLDGDYLALAIRNACNTLQDGDVKGVAVKHLHLNVLRSLNLSLPPLAEQHRIVAKVDELMALCDRLKADLATARQHQARLADTLIDAALEAA